MRKYKLICMFVYVYMPMCVCQVSTQQVGEKGTTKQRDDKEKKQWEQRVIVIQLMFRLKCLGAKREQMPSPRIKEKPKIVFPSSSP